jgi:hypothetical protein
MREVGFYANTEDRDRQRTEWIYQANGKMIAAIGLSYLCCDYYFSFHFIPRPSPGQAPTNHDHLDDMIGIELRFREPAAGGGNHRRGFWAMAKVFEAMRELAEHPHLPFPAKPARAAPWEYRAADEGYGAIGSAIANDGTVLFAALPHENTKGMFDKKGYGILLTFSPQDTPRILYQAWVNFYHGMAMDNFEKFRGGNHA